MLRTLRLLALLSPLLFAPAIAGAQPGLVAVEILPVAPQDEAVATDADALHAEVAVAHGIAPLADWIAHRPDGSTVHVRLWNVPDGRSLEALRHDERCGAVGHAAHAEHGWLLTKAREPHLRPSELSWIELVVPRAGYDLRDHAPLHGALVALGERYGIRSQTSLVALSFGAGPWDGVMKVELWSVPSREALDRLRRDPEWPELERRLHEIQQPHPLSGMLAEAR